MSLFSRSSDKKANEPSLLREKVSEREEQTINIHSRQEGVEKNLTAHIGD